MTAGLIVLIILALFVFIVAAMGVRIVPQARAGIVERLGRYSRTLDPGLTLIVPFIDRVKPLIDLREQVVSFPPQPVITEDNLVVGIDTVIYFTVTDPRAATYEVANPLQAIEQLTVTTLRNVIGGMTLEDTLTSRDNINNQLRAVLDEATGRWGIRVNRVELKSVEPPRTVQEAMEKQMRAERDRRATILTAEGVKQSQILTAEGEKQSAVLRAEGARTAAILRPRARPRRSRPSSARSTTAPPTRRCSPTSTCRCSRSSPRATPTRSGSSRRSSPRRSATSPTASPRPTARRPSPRSPARAPTRTRSTPAPRPTPPRPPAPPNSPTSRRKARRSRATTTRPSSQASRRRHRNPPA